MAFPPLIPSSRRFTPSQFPITRHKFMTGQKQSMLFATNAYKAELRLVYANRSTSEIALLMAHYDQQEGTHSSFKFPGKWAEQVWGGWNDVGQDEETLATSGRWRYGAPPRITQQRGKVATAEVVVVQVPGTTNVRCDGPGSPLDPGTPINPAPGAPEGPNDNGPNGFPGRGGGPDGSGGDGGGGQGPGQPSALSAVGTPDPGVFPNHTPSRRSMKYGEWNTRKSNPGKSDQAVTLPLAKKSIKSEVILELVYANRADGVARDFMNHYLAAAGEWDDFKLPGEKLKKGPLAGWSVKNGDRYLSKGRWAYNRPPTVESVHPNTSTVTVQLISLESKAFAGPGVEIKPLQDCECPPPYSPGLPPPTPSPGPEVPSDPDAGPGTPSPTPEPEPFPWPYVVPEYPIDDPKYVSTTVKVTYHSWRSQEYNCQTGENVGPEGNGTTITRESSGNIAGIRIKLWDKAVRTYICDAGEDTIVYKTYFIIEKYVTDSINGGWKWSNLFDPAEGYDGESYTLDESGWDLAKRDPGDLGWVSDVQIIKEGTPVVLPPYQNPFPDQTVPEE